MKIIQFCPFNGHLIAFFALLIQYGNKVNLIEGQFGKKP